MNKYIDADKLISKIEKLKNELKSLMVKLYYAANYKEWEAELNGYNKILSFVTFLQQEQPEVDEDFFFDEVLKVYDNNNKYPPRSEEELTILETVARHFYELGLNARKKELPEIGLDKFTDKVNTFKARYKHPESISIKGAMAFMARMFYQYPNVARQWYDSLPKTTMD